MYKIINVTFPCPRTLGHFCVLVYSCTRTLLFLMNALFITTSLHSLEIKPKALNHKPFFVWAAVELADSSSDLANSCTDFTIVGQYLTCSSPIIDDKWPTGINQ